MLLRHVVGSLALASAGWAWLSYAEEAKPETTTTTTQPAAAPAPGRVLGPPVAPPSAAETAEDETDPFTETLLTSTIAYLNQGYLSIGILSDAIAAGAYEEEEARALLEAHQELAKHVEVQLRTLAKAPELDAEDVAAMNDLVKLAQLNVLQSATLIAIFEGDDSKEAAWEQLREAALKELEKYGAEETSPETAAQTTPTVTK